MSEIVWVGYAAAALTTAVFIPQLIKSLKTKHTKDLSLPMMITQIAGLSLWLTYGLWTSEPVIITANTIALPIGVGLLIAKLKYH